jgi:hypothetical protein
VSGTEPAVPAEHPRWLDETIEEIRARETQIRETLRLSTQTANLSAVVLALAVTYIGGRPGEIALSLLPLLLTVVALSNLNAATDAAQMAEQRDWLERRANRALGAPVFVTGAVAHLRRTSRSGLAVNALAGLILVASWVGGLVVASGQPWLWWQVAMTTLLVGLTGAAATDFATIRRRTSGALATLNPPQSPVPAPPPVPAQPSGPAGAPSGSAADPADQLGDH